MWKTLPDDVELGNDDAEINEGIPMTEGTIKLKSDSIDNEEIPDEEGEKPKEFTPSKGLTSEEAKVLLEKWGRNELMDKKKPKWLIFMEQLWQPMPIMIWIASITEAGISNWPDMAILLAIQFINASLGYYEITKAGDAVAALKKSLKPLATVKRNGKWQNIDAAEVVPGDLVLLAAGSAVPADCLVNDGTIDVDQAALTGESLPVTMYKGHSCKMGSNVVRGEVEGTVEFTGSNTFFGKTASLLQESDEQGSLQKVLLNIVIVLVVLSLTLSGIVFTYLLTQYEDVKETISFTVVLIVASIPVAIEIVCTTTLALGSKELSKHGAIVTRLAAIEDMAGMTMLCSDKTGTLTMNKMMIQEETPVYWPGETQYSILRYAAMAAKWHEPARDALDTMVLGQADLNSLESVEQLDYVPFDPIVKRTEGTVRETATGKTYKVTKGAPHVILKLTHDEKIKAKCEHDVHAFGGRGIRCLAVAKTDDDGNFRMLGLLTFLDPPRHDTKDTIHRAISYGVEVKMVTGDHLLIAMETARMLELGDRLPGSNVIAPNIKGPDGLPMLHPETKKAPEDLSSKYGDYIRIGHGFAQVFPEHKFLIRMKNFITYRIAATLQLLIFFFIAVLALHPKDFMPSNWETLDGFDSDAWPDYFKLPVLMLMLITLLNDGTLISVGYDNVVPSRYPNVWNLPVLFLVSSVLAGVALLSSLILLYLTLDSWHHESWFYKMGIGELSYGQITTIMYLKVSISDFLTLFSARTHDGFFWSSRPSIILLAAASFSLCLSTLLACVWPKSTVDGQSVVGLTNEDPKAWAVYVWIYCIIWWLIQDAAKVVLYWWMGKYNIFGINDSLKISKELQDLSDALAEETAITNPLNQSANNTHDDGRLTTRQTSDEEAQRHSSEINPMSSGGGNKYTNLNKVTRDSI
eukprot:gene7402-7984_t